MNHVQKSGDFLRRLETFFEFWKKIQKIIEFATRNLIIFRMVQNFASTAANDMPQSLSLLLINFNLILRFANVQSLEANLRICIFRSELQRVLGSCNHPSTTRLQVIANTKSTVDLFHHFYHGMNAIGT